MIFWVLAALGFLPPTPPPAQPSAPAQVDETWSLRAVVADAKGVPVRDLTPSDVSLSEGGATVSLTRFEKDERPARVALLIDSSQPMASAYRLQFMDAAKAFIASLPSNVRLTVWTTGDRPAKLIDDLDLNEDNVARDVESRLARVLLTGGNTMLDAVVEAAEDLEKKEGERNIVVFLSGSGAGFSNDNRESIVDRVSKRKVEVTGVLIAESGESSEGGDVSPQDYDYVFGGLTDRFGGRFERPLTVMAAKTALLRVAADLRSTYRLAYIHKGGGRRSKLALQVARQNVKVRLSTPQKETSAP